MRAEISFMGPMPSQNFFIFKLFLPNNNNLQHLNFQELPFLAQCSFGSPYSPASGASND